MVRRFAWQTIASILLIAAFLQPAFRSSVAAQALAQGDAAFVRFIHASPTAPGLDLRLDGALVVQALAFGAATDIFVSVAAGQHTVDAIVADGDGAAVISGGGVELSAGVAYDVAVVGLVDAASLAVFPVDSSMPGDGRARVRLIVCTPDAEGVSLVGLGNQGAVEGIAFPVASEYVEIEAGGYDLTLDAVGAEQRVTIELGGVAFEAGGIYDLVVLGLVADGSLSVLVVAV